MSEWKKKQLQEIAILKPTETLKKGDIAPNIPMANIKEFQRDVVKIDYGEFRGGTKFRNGDTLLAKITPCLENGKTAFVNCLQEDEIGFGSTEFIVLRAKENIDERFLYYLSISPEFRKQAISLMEGTSGRKRVNENALKISDFLIPDFEEQKKIANILSAIDDKISLNNQINQELEAMAKTLYDYWFVQFDFPDQNGKPYKSSGGKMVYNPELKREIPEGWGVEKLNSLLKIGKETTNPKKFPNEEFKYYSIPEFDTTGTYSLERGDSIKSNKFKVEKNDLLVSKLNPWFNRVIYNLEENAISSTEFIVWKTFNRFEKNFLYQVATGKEFIEYCTRFATGTSNSHKRVSPDIMVSFQIPFEKTYIQKFGEITDSIRAQVLQNNEQNQELTQLRDWLLPMLMNGQVKVE